MKQRLKCWQLSAFIFIKIAEYFQQKNGFYCAFTSPTFFDALRAFIYKARRASKFSRTKIRYKMNVKTSRYQSISVTNY